MTDEYDDGDGDDRYRSKFYRGLTAEKHRKVLRDVALAAVNATRAKRSQREAALAADWQIQTSNSFRRIGAHGDGDVLCGTNHPIDRHPDLLAPSGVLEYVVAAQPCIVLSLLDTVEKIEREVLSLQEELRNMRNATKITDDLQGEQIDRCTDPCRSKPTQTFTVDVDVDVAQAAMQIGARPKAPDARARLDELMGADSTNYLGTGLTLCELTQLGVMEKLASSWALQPREERQRRRKAILRLAVELDHVRETTQSATRLAEMAIECVIEGDWTMVEEWADHFSFEDEHDGPGSKNAIAYATFRELLLQVLRTEKNTEV